MTRSRAAMYALARRTPWRVALASFVLVLLTACGADGARSLQGEVVARYPHDPNAFTQGLLWHEGWLFESTGRYGASSLRRVELGSGEVRDVRYLPEDLFGEGLARVDDELLQLTWRAGQALRWPLETFAEVEGPRARHEYDGEGWGLCFDGRRLVMSDGSDRLSFRDPASLEETGGVRVTLDGEPLENLNELECVGNDVWANVWFEDRIVRIDPGSGRVTGTVDLSGLLSDEERAELGEGAVLNGIAWRSGADTLFVTGKDWPALFEVRIEGLGRD